MSDVHAPSPCVTAWNDFLDGIARTRTSVANIGRRINELGGRPEFIAQDLDPCLMRWGRAGLVQPACTDFPWAQ